MVIDLSSGGMILLLVGTYVFAGCLGFVLGCCLRMAKKSQDGSISCNSCAGGEQNCNYCKMFGLYSAYKRRKGPPEDKK